MEKNNVESGVKQVTVVKKKVEVVGNINEEQPGMSLMNPEVLLSQAIKQNASVDTIERLLAMRRELKAEWAKEEFNKSMAMFQSECPVITKSKEGGKTASGKVAYHYAPLETIVPQVQELINKHNFSYRIKTETKDKTVISTCIVHHNAGHSEESSMEVPLGSKTGIMSDTQQVAAATTFAKRYAFCNAFGILTGDEDNDGAGLDVPPTGQKNTPTANKDPKKSSNEEVKQKFIKTIENAKTIAEVVKVEEFVATEGDKFKLTNEFKEKITYLAKKKIESLG